MGKNLRCLVCETALSGKQEKYCSTKCKVSGQGANSYECQKTRALVRKKEIVFKKGGRCENCGYDRNLAVLEFHHLDPAKKSFRLDSRKLSNSKMESILNELEKCALLCANCHRELHNPSLFNWNTKAE